MPRLPIVRRGMTLVELLVVVGIILTLFVAVAPNFVNTAEARRSREAARMVSSFVAKAQSRALGRPELAGFMVAAAGTASFAALDLFLADVPPPYRGDTIDATITISGTGDRRRAGTPSANALASVATIGSGTSDLIRFGGRGPFYELTGPPTPSAIEIRMLGFEDSNLSPDDLGYTSRNTPWPAPVSLPFEIFRQPDPAGSPLTLPDGRAIDLKWSGYGPPQVQDVNWTYRRFVDGQNDLDVARELPVRSVSVLFDGTGRLRLFVVATASLTRRWAVTGPVFLLVGRVDRAGQAFAALDAADDTLGANWQYPDSWWVAIDPMTGVARSAECVPGAVDVVASQRWIREALLGSGR
jgi:prepilin-type N-terminal cleavage/methylation domain-containing protein